MRVKFWRDWTTSERAVFAVLAVVVLVAVAIAPSLLGVVPSVVVLVAGLILWGLFNAWILRRHRG